MYQFFNQLVIEPMSYGQKKSPGISGDFN